MSELKVPTTMKIMYVASIALALAGVIMGNNIAVAVSVVIMVILSCAVSILEGIHQGFERLIKLEIANAKLENKGG